MKLIAETAWHHDGDFDFFKKLVTDLSTKTKADYLKFHVTLDVDEYIYKDHQGYQWVKESVFSENQFIPNYFVDISDFIIGKTDLMKIYSSELGEHPFPRSIRNIEALATFRGAFAGVEYAEAFQIIHIIDK